jgi:chromosome partitioning protein
MYDVRRKLTFEVSSSIKEFFKKKVFKSVIRENVSLAEAPIKGVDIFRYEPKSHGAQDYYRLAKEVING